MNRRRLAPGIVLLPFIGLVGCDGLSGTSAPSGDPGSSINPSPVDAETGGSNVEAPALPGGPVAVGDVTLEIAGREIGAGGDSGSRVSARVINDSDRTIEVTLRFLFNDQIVHLAYLQVIPHTVTTVVSPDEADEVRVSGVDDDGNAIPRASFLAGVDFTDDEPAVFRMLPVELPEVDDPGDEVVVIDPPAPPPYTPPPIVALAPDSNLSLPLGSVIDVRWNDESAVAGAVVLVGLRPRGSNDDAAFVQLAPAVAEALDGINDEIRVVLQGIEPGQYDLLTIIDDGVTRVESTAPGSVTLLLAPDNVAPTIDLTFPDSAIELQSGEVLRVAWEDADIDDNATIIISLEPSAGADPGTPSYVISPPLAEDPDGVGADEAVLVIEGVLPGQYDLVGVIDDGSLVGVSRREALVKVVPDAENDVPWLIFVQPEGEEIRVNPGGSIPVAWTDGDDNDNAMISLMLDPDLSEDDLILLVTALAEDPDGSGDRIQLGIPETVPAGSYRIAGAITDGVSRMVAFAPATVLVAPGDGDPPPVRSLRILGGVRDDVLIRLGDLIKVEAELDDISDAQFFLSNMDFDGNVRVELIPRLSGEEGDSGTLTLNLLTANVAIPNDAWPRKFVLEMLVTIGLGGKSTFAVRPVWVFQDVVMLDIELHTLACEGDPTSDESSSEDLNEVIMTWFGGDFCDPEEIRDMDGPRSGVGCPESLERVELDFWLTADGEIPGPGECPPQDRCPRHRLFLTTESSPNQIRTSQIAVTVFEGMESGTYEVAVVDQSRERMPIIGSFVGPLIIELCFPAE